MKDFEALRLLALPRWLYVFFLLVAHFKRQKQRADRLNLNYIDVLLLTTAAIQYPERHAAFSPHFTLEHKAKEKAVFGL